MILSTKQTYLYFLITNLYFLYSINIETSKGRWAEPYNPIWTISDLFLPIVGYYACAKFRADHSSRSGGVRVGKNSEGSIGAPLN
jgi:hypothetical protein